MRGSCKYFCILSVLTNILLLIFSGCGDYKNTVKSTEKSPDQITLRLLVDDSFMTPYTALNAQMNTLIDAFEADNEHVKIEVEMLNEDLEAREIQMQQMRVEIMAGQGPDLYLLPTVMNPDYLLFTDVNQVMYNGVFADISPWYDSDDSLEKDGLNTAVMDAGVVDGKRYAVLIIRPFQDIPHVCVHSIEDELRSGVFYIRSASASSRPAARAGEMHDLVRRALRNQREMLAGLLRDILGDMPQRGRAIPGCPDNGEQLPPEYEESVSYFQKRQNPHFVPGTPVLDLAIMPLECEQTKQLSLSSLRAAAESALRKTGQESSERFLNATDLSCSYATNVSLRGMNKEHSRFWQLFQNGLLHFRSVIDGAVEYNALRSQLLQLLEPVKNYYAALPGHCRKLFVQLTIENSDGLDMVSANGSVSSCRIGKVRIVQNFELDNSENAPADPIAQIMDELSVRFNAPTDQKTPFEAKK